jgi:hypothetical protein
MLAETEALRSTGSGRLLRDVMTQLEVRRESVAQMRRDHAEALTERSEAGQQLSLQRKWVAECDAQLGKAIDQGKSGQEVSRLINLRGDALNKIPRLEKRLSDLDEQLTRLNEAEQHVRFLEERRLSLTPELEMIKERRDAAYASERALRTKHKQVVWQYTPELEELKEKASGFDAIRSTLKAGPERDEIMIALDKRATRQVEIEEELLAAERRLKFAENNLGYWEGRYSNYAKVAAAGGLTEDELKKLGFKPHEAEEALKTARQLARQGLRSAEQVDRIVRDVNAVMSKLSSRRFGIDGAVEAQSDALAGATNELKAKNLGDTLLRSLTGNTQIKMSDDGVAAAVAKALEDKLGPYRPGTVVPLAAAELEECLEECLELNRLGEPYRDAQKDMVRNIAWGRKLDGDHGRMVARIEQFSLEHGLGWDAEHPPGLSVSRNLLEAVRILDEAPPLDRTRFAHLAKALAGFNPKQMSVPFFQFNKDALTAHEIADYGKNVPLMEAAKAIVFLREIEPGARAVLKRAISADALQLDKSLDDRREKMGPDTFGVVRDTIRAAILDVMPNAPGAVTSFNPADHAREIRDKLESWAFPVDRFEPEVTMLLSQSFGPAELEIWVASTKLSDELVRNQDAERQKRVEALAGESQQGGRVAGISAKAKEQLLSQVDQMQPGTWVVLGAGDRVEMQTGRMPVEPTDFLGINIKVAAGKMDSLEIGRGINTYELVLLDGGDGRFTGELWARLFEHELTSYASSNANAVASLEGAGYRVTGVSISTPNTAKGRDAIKAILSSLLTKGQIETPDLSDAESIMPVVEWTGSIRAGVRANVAVVAKPKEWQTPSFQGSGVGFEADVSASARYGDTFYTSSNTNTSVVRRDQEVIVALSAGVAASATLAAPITNINGTPHTASTDPLTVLESTAFSYKIRSSEVRGPDGLVQAATKQRQVMAPSTGKEAIVSRMGGDLFQRVIAGMPAEAHESIRTLINASGPGDMISIGYSLDERVRTEANRLLKEAKGLRSGAIPSASRAAAVKRAEELESQTQSLLDDNDSYIPSKVQLVPTTETLSQLKPLDLVFVNWTTYARSKSESIAAEVKLDVDRGMALRAEGLRQGQALLDASPSSD